MTAAKPASDAPGWFPMLPKSARISLQRARDRVSSWREALDYVAQARARTRTRLRNIAWELRHGRRARLEQFGAIIQLVYPRALVFVDRARARTLDLAPPPGSRLWADAGADGAVGAHTLTAPLEAHLQITNRCDAGCRGCYTAATPRGDRDEWGLADWKRAVDALADMGVFHLALGGGESAQLPWLGQLARYARHRGLVPNLTTSGLAGLAQLLPIADEFGQINVSLDGLSGDGGTYAAVRGFDGFARADAAVRALRKRKAEIGINVVVTRHNFHQIDALFAYARKRRLNEIELLRFKPAGRGVRAYAALACTDEQHRQFLPRLLAACKRHRIRARVDCSYTPMLAHHSPDPALLSSLAVYGCTGGDFLVGAKASGQLLACSFAAPDLDRPDLDRPDLDRPDPGPNNTAAAPAAPAPNVHDIGAYWHTPEAFADFRSWRDAEEPCASCRYHTLCRGGCKVVSAHVRGHARLPDPECPRVVDWQRQRADRDSGESGPRADAPTPPRRRLPILDS